MIIHPRTQVIVVDHLPGVEVGPTNPPNQTKIKLRALISRDDPPQNSHCPGDRSFPKNQRSTSLKVTTSLMPLSGSPRSWMPPELCNGRTRTERRTLSNTWKERRPSGIKTILGSIRKNGSRTPEPDSYRMGDYCQCVC